MTQDESLEIIYISDSDSEASRDQLSSATQISLPSSEGGQSQSIPGPSPLDILIIDSTDSEDLDELEVQLKNVCFEKKTKTKPPCSPRPNSNSMPRTSHIEPPLESEFQDDVLVLSSSEEENMFLQLNTRHEASGLNNLPKKAPKSSFRMSKQKGNPSNERSKASKAQEKAVKEQAKLQRDINKLVTDKKSTLKDFTVEISSTFEDHPFVGYLESKLAVHGCSTLFFDPPSRREPLIRFRRQHIAQYDNKTKEWVPVTPYHSLEDLYVLLLSADTLALAVSSGTLTETLSVLRSTHRLTARSQIFLMIDGLNAYYKYNRSRKGKRNAIESALVALQASERCFIIQVEGAEDTAQWLFNVTGDLGIRPHKRIRESFLPFCTDTQVKCGTSKTDTYKKMLQQVRHISESAADGIVEEAPTLRELFEGYAREPDGHSRDERFKEVIISNRKDGVAKSRILNQALSKKLHDVFWGEDPLTLVV
ncbi:unnamed protein product [Rhizoctonia solani]|uniref:ERCC4 domain-containing protein n=1 Tax=Rhizoctonia solani TaxID=456999 RepID=A0A8H2XTZ1_9AGAM|nr:unnamed protein product [Rhizoctonia solani]